MPTREEIDIELLKYLREQKAREKREDDGVRNAIQNLSSQVQLLGQKLDSNHENTQERIKGLVSRVDKLEDSIEDTGVHNIEQLKRERDEAVKETAELRDDLDEAEKETAEIKGELRKYVAASIVALLSGGGVVELLHQLSRGGH